MTEAVAVDCGNGWHFFYDSQIAEWIGPGPWEPVGHIVHEDGTEFAGGRRFCNPTPGRFGWMFYGNRPIDYPTRETADWVRQKIHEQWPRLSTFLEEDSWVQWLYKVNVPRYSLVVVQGERIERFSAGWVAHWLSQPDAAIQFGSQLRNAGFSI